MSNLLGQVYQDPNYLGDWIAPDRLIKVAGRTHPLDQDFSIRFLVTQEVMRQALLALRHIAKGGQGLSFDGLRCLCGTDFRPNCEVKEILELFWPLVTADEGFKEVVETHWKKLECI
jgi:hypothetical protein